MDGITASLKIRPERLDHIRPAYLLHVIVKPSHGKVRNILILPKTLWILKLKEEKSVFLISL